MKRIIEIYKEIESLLGSLKFAVFIILSFVIALIFGTFQESYHGTDYANRLVYKSAGFIILQVLMFLSILLATLHRLPYKHRLRGFYTLHLGLLTLFFGSFITFDQGLDGTMTLVPNVATKELTLNTDQVVITDKSSGETVELDLPNSAGPKVINLPWKEFTVLNYLPFADKEIQWLADSNTSQSAQYSLQNQMVSETLTLSLSDISDFKSSMQLGPLNVHFLPEELFACFKQYPQDKFLLWDVEKSQCLGQSSNKIKTIKGKILKLKLHDEVRAISYEFHPQVSPLPMKNNVPLADSPWRVFNRSLFENNPHLIFFGTALAYYNKNDQQWYHEELKDWVTLPWMGFKTKLIRFEKNLAPVHVPVYKVPVQDNNQLIIGKERAVEMMIKNESGEKKFWLLLDQNLNIQLKNKSYNIGLRKKIQTLPYELRLTKFVLTTDPGTQNAASFESFITLAPSNGKISQHHIFMNNPLKYDNLTFYQASYFDTEQGKGSVLSINYDPGRWIKYLGAFLLVFGAIWHFFFIRRKELLSQEKSL